MSVQVYSTTYCPYCDAAKALLKSLDVPFDAIDVTNDPDMRAELVERTGGLRTVPQIFIHDQSIGGFTELRALVRSGQFHEMLAVNAVHER